MSLRRLGVERIDLWQLHRIDPKVPREEQFASIEADAGRGHRSATSASSEVSVEEIKAAQEVFRSRPCRTSTTSTDRAAEDVLDYCEPRASASSPGSRSPRASSPSRAGRSQRDRRGARRHAGQIALAWLLKRSPVMLPIPGTARSSTSRRTSRAAEIELTDEEFETLDGAAAAA